MQYNIHSDGDISLESEKFVPQRYLGAMDEESRFGMREKEGRVLVWSWRQVSRI